MNSGFCFIGQARGLSLWVMGLERTGGEGMMGGYLIVVVAFLFPYFCDAENQMCDAILIHLQKGEYDALWNGVFGFASRGL